MGILTVKTVSKLSGVGAHTLRAWERRYGAVKPDRSPSGQRTYNLKDVERLRLLKNLIDNGYSIGQIANLPTEELFSLLPQFENEKPSLTNQVHKDRVDLPQAEEVEELLSSLAKYDLFRLNDRLSRLRARMGYQDFALQVISPLMSEIGKFVVNGKFNVAQEHACSAIVRNQITQLIHSCQIDTTNQKKAFGFSTIEGDFHEFGILLGYALCVGRGLKAYYLGASLPPNSTRQAVEALGINTMIIGASPLPPEHSRGTIDDYLDVTQRLRENSVNVWIGGDGVTHEQEKRFSPYAEFVPSLSHLDDLFATFESQLKQDEF